MNIMGVGPIELLVVFVIAFLVLGPDRMSSTARSLGKIVRDLRQQTSGLPRTLDEFLDQPEDQAPDPAAKGPKAPTPKEPQASGVPRPRRRRNADSEAQNTSADDPRSKE